ncbi:HAD family phosphatase [Lachnospiraceae bacterium]|jgi:HAD superfamily hydrolase (TIGR01509 family)|nr:HAD family phosphatase [uncultured Schaedlerella sp.]MCI9153460.1 HAD family phosphatase [Ruminococcus sp.]NBI59767.1 HAD family phosphatase [Lachnospiraceae bacterium]
MNYTGAIFDMDGVLFDTERIYQETWHELAEERRIELGSGFLKAITGTNGERMRRVVEEYYQVPDGLTVMEECMNRMKRKLSEHVPIKDGVCEILHFFREQGVRMAVASSSLPGQIEANLQRAGIRDYFNAVVSGTEVESGKPAPDIFLRAAERIGCRPEECFVFEDSENGVRAGHAAGCITVMVPDLIEPSEAIRPYCAWICRDFFEVRLLFTPRCEL